MSRLPQVSGPDVIRALQKIGFSARRQHGSHIIMRRDTPFAQTVPNHRQIDRGTLRAILRQTDLGVDGVCKAFVAANRYDVAHS